jgi:hypothetical protein
MRLAHTQAKCIAMHGYAIAHGGPRGNSQEVHFENFFIAVVLPGLKYSYGDRFVRISWF